MLPMPSGAVVGFLDTEGFSASDRTADYDAKIFAISALLSTHLLYNSVRIIDTASIECVRRPSPHTLTPLAPALCTRALLPPSPAPRLPIAAAATLQGKTPAENPFAQ